MLRQLKLAVEGRYNPRPDITTDALDDAEHALILGGPRALHALQRRVGFVSKNTILTHRPRPRFITSWGSQVEAATMQTNLERFILASKSPPSKAIHHLMVDDVAVEPRRRPSPEDNLMRGYGRECDFSGLSLEVNSYATLEVLGEAEEEGKLKLAEVCVCACACER